jgi:hypothetical protein
VGITLRVTATLAFSVANPAPPQRRATDHWNGGETHDPKRLYQSATSLAPWPVHMWLFIRCGVLENFDI